MAYIKSHSNYTLKKRHQNINGGRVYERDITTIGGRETYADSQTPMYRSGNFIITTNNASSAKKNLSNESWEENENGMLWTLNDLNVTDGEKKEYEVVLKNDFYRLSDFCYYGSCSELMRSSINDIMRRFPGELCTPYEGENGIRPMYPDGMVSNVDTTNYLYYGDGFLLENPFHINLHTQYHEVNEEDSLKYFANNGYANYQVVFDDGSCYDISSWESDITMVCQTQKMGTVTIGVSNGETITIDVYNSFEKNEVIYLVGEEMLYRGLHIRPKALFYEEFMDSLDNFQRLLLNRRSNPIYKASFEDFNDDNVEIKTIVKDYVFPIGNGGYNIGSNPYTFGMYLEELNELATKYDTVYSDNLMRSMTHESINNLSEALNKFEDEGGDLVVYDTNKILNVLRIYGREFDEIKNYIDNISTYNLITYDGRYNTPDYLLSDMVNVDGWDTFSVVPFELTEWVLNEDGSKNKDIHPTKEEEMSNKVGDSHLFRKFFQNGDKKIRPYSKEYIGEFKDGYFIMCDCDGEVAYQKVPFTDGDASYKLDCTGKLRPLITIHSDESEYTMNDANLHFLKMLKLNSRGLLRRKGTIEGVEMMLSLFGLKSRKWLMGLPEDVFNNLSDNTIDFDIKEYTSFTNGIVDKVSNSVGLNKLDWYNYTKTISYDTEEYMNGVYLPYQGLPVTYREMSDGSRVIYPYFDKNVKYDGNPWFQMNGGWLKKEPAVFDNDNNLIYGVDDLFTETVRNIKSVDNLNELLSMRRGLLTDGEIYYVRNLDAKFAVIDGVVYELHSDYYEGTEYEYIFSTVVNGTVKIGDTTFRERITRWNPIDMNYETIFLRNEENGSQLKLYVKDGTIYAENDTERIDRCEIFRGMDGTHYFKINNVLYSQEVSDYGWSEISQYDTDYLKINYVKDYFKGNNPHNSNNRYDGGYGYVFNFMQLFNFPLKKGLFDSRCYVNKDESYERAVDEVIPEIGFWNLGRDAEDCTLDYFLEEDSKLHYFGDYLFFDENKYTYGVDYDLRDIETCGDGSRYGEDIDVSKHDVNDFIKGAEVDSSTHQIVNVKVVDVNFHLKSKQMFSKDWLEEIKYLDTVVVPYASQMIPSTSIVNINYITNGGEYAKDADYILMSIAWELGAGTDLDITTTINGIDALKGKTAGWQGTNNTEKYMEWVSDNKGNFGSEGVLFKVKNMTDDFSANKIGFDLFTRWFRNKGTSECTVTITVFHGGEPIQVDNDWVVEDGTIIDKIEIPVTVNHFEQITPSNDEDDPHYFKRCSDYTLNVVYDAGKKKISYTRPLK